LQRSRWHVSFFAAQHNAVSLTPTEGTKSASLTIVVTCWQNNCSPSAGGDDCKYGEGGYLDACDVDGDDQFENRTRTFTIDVSTYSSLRALIASNGSRARRTSASPPPCCTQWIFTLIGLSRCVRRSHTTALPHCPLSRHQHRRQGRLSRQHRRRPSQHLRRLCR
jgi:hypothetical protein